MRNYMESTQIFINKENIYDNQRRWEYLKYEIR